MFEIPKVGSEKSYTGEYLFVAHNTSFDYWIIGEMNVGLVNKNYVVNFKPYGKYTASYSGYNNDVHKDLVGKDVIFGGGTGSHHSFDEVGSRKYTYNILPSEDYAKRLGQNVSTLRQIKGKEIVKKYHKKKK